MPHRRHGRVPKSSQDENAKTASLEQLTKRRSSRSPLRHRFVQAVLSSEGKTSSYMRAKSAENRQQFDVALYLFSKAIQEGDRSESAVKDVAGILHSLGRSREAVSFLVAHEDLMSDRRTYQNLLNNLQKLWNDEELDTPDSMRTVEVRLLSVPPSTVQPFEWSLCQSLFPNSARIRRLLVCGRRAVQGFIEFASHSAARKAIQRYEGSDVVQVCWARPEVKPAFFFEEHDEICDQLHGGMPRPLSAAPPEVIHLPDDCYSVADMAVFHLLPRALWQCLYDLGTMDSVGN